MEPYELFNHIWDVEYKVTGFDLNYKVEVDKDEKKIRLLFQPSASVKDWIVNFCFLPVLAFPLLFCFGWYSVFKRCKALILEEVLGYYINNPGYTVEICGHSYGGAMSVIAGFELWKSSGLKADIVTFGAPCPLFLFISKWLSRLFLGNVTQYAHKSDIVTYAPFLGFHNVKVIRIGKFSFKGLFYPQYYHMSYDDPELYK